MSPCHTLFNTYIAQPTAPNVAVIFLSKRKCRCRSKVSLNASKFCKIMELMMLMVMSISSVFLVIIFKDLYNADSLLFFDRRCG